MLVAVAGHSGVARCLYPNLKSDRDINISVYFVGEHNIIEAPNVKHEEKGWKGTKWLANPFVWKIG